MKKITVSILTAILASLALVAPAAALSPSLFYGEYHNYSVTFKEDGEAVVYAKLVFTNSGTEDITSYSFKAQDSELKELTMLQVKLPQECADYTQIYDSITGRNKCARYKDPDYNSYYYYSYGSTEDITYRTAKFSNEDLSYSVTLPEALKPGKTTALLLAYTSTSYTSNIFLAKAYNFPTLSISNRITEAKIGVSVDEGLVIEGLTTPTYCTMGMCPISATKDVSLSSIGEAGNTPSAPVTNRSLDNLFASIGSGQKVYEAKSIAPEKSFKAEGKYATSQLRLNSQSLIISVLSVVVFTFIVVIISLKLRNKSSKTQTSNKGKWTSLNLLGKMVPTSSFVPMAALISGTWYLSTENFTRNIWGALNGAGKAMVTVLIVLLYLVLIFVAPVIYAVKNGWRAALSVIIMQTIWATLLLAITLPIIIFTN